MPYVYRELAAVAQEPEPKCGKVESAGLGDGLVTRVRTCPVPGFWARLNGLWRVRAGDVWTCECKKRWRWDGRKWASWSGGELG